MGVVEIVEFGVVGVVVVVGFVGIVEVVAVVGFVGVGLVVAVVVMAGAVVVAVLLVVGAAGAGSGMAGKALRNGPRALVCYFAAEVAAWDQ